MNPKWMMTDKERKARMEDRRRRTGEEEAAATTTATMLVTPFISHLGRGIFYKTPNTLYTNDEMQQVFTLIKLGRNAYFKVLTDLLSRDILPARIVYEMNMLGRRADPPFIDRLEKLLREAHRSMFTALSEEVAVCPEISNLDQRDLDVLAEHNFDCYFATMCSHYFCNPDFHNNLRSMCRYMMEERKDVLKFHNFKAVLEAFQDFERSGRQLQLDYDKVYDCPSPTHPAADSGPKRRLREILRKLQAWPREAPGQPCDVVCATINVAVRMLSTVGLPPASLRNRSAVERLQEQFVQMLYRYLIFLHDGSAGRAGSRLASGWVSGLGCVCFKSSGTLGVEKNDPTQFFSAN